MRKSEFGAGLVVWGFCAAACAQVAPVAQRLATQNALFEEVYQTSLQSSPETATSLGEYRYNGLLDDYSLANVMYQQAVNDAYLVRLKAISTEGFSEQDLLSHELLVGQFENGDLAFGFKGYEMPVNQMGGVHTGVADLPLSMPFDTVQHYEDYVSRLHQIPRVFRQTEDTMRQGMKDNLMPVKFLLEKVPGQCDGIVASNPFLIPTKKYPNEIPAADQARLTKEITDTVNNEVMPAYKEFRTFVANDYAPHGRTTLAETSLPNGVARYQADIFLSTTTKLTAAEIHEIGLKEVARIQGEMLVIAKSQGFTDAIVFRDAVKKNPRFIPTSSEQILDDFRRYIAQMQLKLPELFTVIPGQPVTVEAIPDFQPGNATHYQTGTPDGKQPGRVVVATADFKRRSMVGDEATAYHEGIPGHHMQGSVALTLKNLPKFRILIFNSGYAEGWALYSEQLGKEVGFYKDPISDYGRLEAEMLRAVRLVVDTGIHSQGWIRDQVVDYMRKTAGLDEPEIQSETDRYIAWPGQALSYKLGQLKFRELRERAKTELGPKFDIRAFHDEMLSGGVLPLDLLDKRTDEWIAAQKGKGAPGS